MERLLLTSKEEMERRLLVLGKVFSQERLDELWRDTGGWVEAVDLAVRTREKRQTALEEPLHRYLLDSLGPVSRIWGMMLAPLDAFTTEQAEELTGAGDTLVRLREWEARGGLIYRLPGEEHYRMYGIVRRALLRGLRESQLDQQELYRRCGNWFAGHGDPVAALRFYHKAGMDEAVMALIMRRGGSEYYDRVPEEVEDTFRRSSEDLKQRYPVAYLAYLHDRTMIDETGQAAAEVLAVKARYEGDPSLPERTQILGEIALIESFFCFNDAKQMGRYHKKANLYLGSWTSRIFGPEMVFTFGASQLLYLYHRTPGELGREVATIEEGLGSFVRATGGCGAGGEYLIRAEWALETGRWEECRRAAERAEVQAAWNGQASLLLALHFLWMRLALAQGDRAAYEEERRRLAESQAEWTNPLLWSGAELALGYLEAKDGPPVGGKLLLQCVGWRDIVYGRSLLRGCRYIELEVLAHMMLTSRAAENHVMVRLYALLYQAAALSGQSGPTAGVRALEGALGLAEPDEITLPFAELGAELLPVLAKMDMRRPFVRRVWEECRRYVGMERRARAPDHAAVVLTAMEGKVAELVTRGYKQSEIAEHLCISVNTVKTHLLHLHQKLGVRTRAELIDKYTKMDADIHRKEV